MPLAPLTDMTRFDLPLLEVLPNIACMTVFMLFLLMAVCGPVLAVTAETLFIAKKKAFFDKFGLQSAQLTFWAVFPICLFLLAYLQISIQARPVGTPQLEGLQMMLPGMAVSFFWAAIFLVYRFTWEMLKNARTFHLFLGYMSAFLSLGTLLLAFLGIVCVMQPTLTELLLNKPLPTAEVFSPSALYILAGEFAASGAAWCFFLYLLCTGFATAGCFVLPWLLFRRKSADYGRDYYAFAMRHAALWAAAGQMIAVAAGGAGLYLLWQSPLHTLAQPQDPLTALAACALPLCCIALWGAIVFGKTPLRHKPGAIIACFLFFTALCAQVFTLLRALPVL